MIDLTVPNYLSVLWKHVLFRIQPENDDQSVKEDKTMADFSFFCLYVSLAYFIGEEGYKLAAVTLLQRGSSQNKIMHQFAYRGLLLCDSCDGRWAIRAHADT